MVTDERKIKFIWNSELDPRKERERERLVLKQFRKSKKSFVLLLISV